MKASICLLVALAAMVPLALAEEPDKEYSQVSCWEPTEDMTPDNDPEADKHCKHTKVDSRSVPTSGLDEEADRLWGWKCTVLYAGQCTAVCATKGNVGNCTLRWYWWIFLIKEVNCSCLLYGTTTAAATT